MQEELANTLLEHKADVNLTDSDGRTLLHLALARSKCIAVQNYSLFNMNLSSVKQNFHLSLVGWKYCVDDLNDFYPMSLPLAASNWSFDLSNYSWLELDLIEPSKRFTVVKSRDGGVEVKNNLTVSLDFKSILKQICFITAAVQPLTLPVWFLWLDMFSI